MPIDQFYMYFEEMIYMLRCQSEEGLKANKKADRTDIARWGYL